MSGTYQLFKKCYILLWSAINTTCVLAIIMNHNFILNLLYVTLQPISAIGEYNKDTYRHAIQPVTHNSNDYVFGLRTCFSCTVDARYNAGQNIDLTYVPNTGSACSTCINSQKNCIAKHVITYFCMLYGMHS